MMERALSQVGLPVVRFAASRVFFLVCAAVSIAILEWAQQLRALGHVHLVTRIYVDLFIYYDYYAAIGTLLILVGAIFVPSRVSFRGLLRWLGEHPGTVACLSGIVMAAGALAVYHDHPLSMDEYAAYFQSRIFAAGHLTGHWPPALIDWLLPEQFQNYFFDVSHSSGDVVSSYWPSFALLLTPFTALRIPWACNPVISALTLLVIHRLALRIFADVETAGLAVLLTAASPELFINGISYYSMPAHLLANCVFALLLLQPTPRRALLAGVVGSIALSLHNPVPHMLFAAPWIVWVATRPRGLRVLAGLLVGYAPLCLLLGLGWFWFATHLMHDGAGAGAGAPASSLEHIGSVFAFPGTPILLARLMGAAKIWLWSVPGLLALSIVGGWRWRHKASVRLVALSAVITFVGYLFVPMDQGHGWGYRYFHTAWLALPLLGAAAFARSKPAAQDTDVAQSGLRTYVVACALLSLTAGMALRAVQVDSFISDDLRQMPASAGSSSVVFINAASGYYAEDLVRNDPFLRTSTLRLLSRSGKANAELMAKFFPGYRLVHADAHGEVWSAGAPAD